MGAYRSASDNVARDQCVLLCQRFGVGAIVEALRQAIASHGELQSTHALFDQGRA